MHSRIFQLEFNPVEEFDLLSEETIYDLNSWFLDIIGDYVDSDTDREEDIEWLLRYLSSLSDRFKFDEEQGTITFFEGFKEDYFRDRYNKMKEAVEKITLKEFAGVEGQLNLFDIMTAIEDRFGFYVYHEGVLQNMDSFVRLLEPNRPYYFGATLDYHY